MARIEALVATVEASGDAKVRDAARDLVRALLELHAEGLVRVRDAALGAGDAGARLWESAAADPRVTAMLALHDLHPVPRRARVVAALEEVRRVHPEVEVVRAGDDEVKVKVRHADARRRAQAEAAVREALEARAPDVERVLVDVEGEPLVALRRKEAGA